MASRAIKGQLGDPLAARLTGMAWCVDRRWVFDLVLSNPDAVRLYRMSPQRYVTAAGCAH